MSCYVGDGELFCEKCAIARNDITADMQAIGGQADEPRHCGDCARPLWDSFGLTANGIQHVITAIEARLREGTAPTDYRWPAGYYEGFGKHEQLRDWATYLRWDSETSLDRRESRLCDWLLYLTAPGTHGHPSHDESPADRDHRLERAGQDRDLILSQGFSRGNYANAYETQDYAEARDALPSPSDDYLAAFALGFFSSYELHEIDCEHTDEYLEAYHSAAGQRCIELGFIDPQDDESEES